MTQEREAAGSKAKTQLQKNRLQKSNPLVLMFDNRKIFTLALAKKWRVVASILSFLYLCFTVSVNEESS